MGAGVQDRFEPFDAAPQMGPFNEDVVDVRDGGPAEFVAGPGGKELGDAVVEAGHGPIASVVLAQGVGGLDAALFG